MPTRFLSDAEIERLERFPETIDRRDLARHFQLDSDDLRFVRQQNGAPGRLGIALQLCSLRWLGFVPEELSAAPPEAISTVAASLDVPVRAVFDYSVRAPTRREHRLAVREHARFVAAGQAELESMRGWLLERALEHERPSLLFFQACVELRRRRVERPAIDRVMRLVAWARERAHEQTFERLAPQLTDARRAELDALLAASAGERTRHAWLRSGPTAVSGRALRAELEKRRFLIDELAADRFDLDGLPPNRRAWLAQTGRQSSNQALMRLGPERRYPVLMCFCAEALERVTDDALEVSGLLRSYPEPYLAAAGALASATRANVEQIAEVTLASVARVGATFASGHRINPSFQTLVAVQILVRRAAGADDAEPLFLAPDQTRPATPRHVHNWLERIGRETGLRFDTTTGWNRYATPPWATFHELAAAALIAR